MPWLDSLLHKNPVISFFKRLFATPTVSPVLKFALDGIAERKKKRQENPEKNDSSRDFLARFLDIKDAQPGIPDL